MTDQTTLNNSEDVANTLNEILSGKLVGGMDTPVSIQVQVDESPPEETSNVVFPCHLCKDVFTKRKSLQKHIRSHQDFRPSVVSIMVV